MPTGCALDPPQPLGSAKSRPKVTAPSPASREGEWIVMGPLSGQADQLLSVGRLKLRGPRVPHPALGGAAETKGAPRGSGRAAAVRQAGGARAALTRTQKSDQAGAGGESRVYTRAEAPAGRGALPRKPAARLRSVCWFPREPCPRLKV